ncbi:MAG: hypothetical protein V1927_00560 [Candidatus Omnitrophota bacterium]
MDRTKNLKTKTIIECLLRLEELTKLSVAIHIAFKKFIIWEAQKRMGNIKAELLTAEERRFIGEYSAKYMPAIRLNLEQNISDWIICHEQKRQTLKTLREIFPDDILLLYIRASHINDLKSILPIPLNA